MIYCCCSMCVVKLHCIKTNDFAMICFAMICCCVGHLHKTMSDLVVSKRHLKCLLFLLALDDQVRLVKSGTQHTDPLRISISIRYHIIRQWEAASAHMRKAQQP
jgi:hypothetical protein